MVLAGVDACKAGWVMGAANGDLGDLRFAVARTASELFQMLEAVEHAAIDIPIGLPIDKARACDLQARALLGKQGSKVFPAPSRRCLSAEDFVSCCELNRAALSVGLSKQSHALLPKIREIDLEMTPRHQQRIREAHPEVTFMTVAGRPLSYSKRTVAGNIERLRILQTQGLAWSDSVLESLSQLDAGLDDVLDAAACLVTARRIAVGASERLGDAAPDERGLRMEILV